MKKKHCSETLIISKHGRGSEERFRFKIKFIIFRESLAKRKLLHFLMANSVPQLGMCEAHCTEPRSIDAGNQTQKLHSKVDQFFINLEISC